MRKNLILLLGISVFSQEAARLEPVAGVIPAYEGRPAAETFLHGPGRVLTAGTDGFYLMEPGARVLRVDGGGVVRLTRASSRDRTMDTDDAGNLYVHAFPGEVRLYPNDGDSSTLYDFRNVSPIGDAFSVTAFAVSRDGKSHYFTNSFGLWKLPVLGVIGSTEARRARRMWHDGSEVFFITVGGDRVYRGATLLAESPGLELMDVTGDSNGRVYVAGRYSRSVCRIVGGALERVAGAETGVPAAEGVPAVEAVFRSVDSIAVDSAGRLLIVDAAEYTVWRVEADGRLARAAGKARTDTGSPDSSALSAPAGLAYDQDGNLFVVERLANRIRVLGADGSWTVAASPVYPTGPIGVDGEGWVYFIQDGNKVNRFQRGGAVETWLTRDELDAQFPFLSLSGLGVTKGGAVVVSIGNELFWVTREKSIRRIGSAEGFSFLVGAAELARFFVLGEDEVAINATSSRQVIRVSRMGEVTMSPWQQAADPRRCGFGQLSAAASGDGFVQSTSGGICRWWLDGRFEALAGGAYGSAGEQPVADGQAPLSGWLQGVSGLAVAADGSIVFSEFDTNRVRRYVPAR